MISAALLRAQTYAFALGFGADVRKDVFDQADLLLRAGADALQPVVSGWRKGLTQATHEQLCVADDRREWCAQFV